jgi:hypothetical protein
MPMASTRLGGRDWHRAPTCIDLFCDGEATVCPGLAGDALALSEFYGEGKEGQTCMPRAEGGG